MEVFIFAKREKGKKLLLFSLNPKSLPFRTKKYILRPDSFTEAPPLGPWLESAPPRISNRIQFQGGRRRGKMSWGNF